MEQGFFCGGEGGEWRTFCCRATNESDLIDKKEGEEGLMKERDGNENIQGMKSS